jgi:hypothetical protein
MSESDEAWMRDISEKMGSVLASQDAMKTVIERIEEQTTKTNGRVSKLEAWKTRILGGCAVITFLVTAIWAVLFPH